MITIRNATLNDLPIIVRFNKAMARETEHRELDALLLEEGVRSVFIDPSRGIYYVAQMEDEIVGCLLITYEWSDWRNGVFWWIQSVYVAPERRRNGVFREFYKHLKSLAKTNSGVCGLRLYVEESNRNARSVYSSLSMKETGYRIYEMDLVLGGT